MLDLKRNPKAKAETAPAAPVESQEAEAPVAAPKASKEAVAPVIEVDKSILNTLSDKIAFVAPLGNPLKDDVTQIEVDGQKQKKVTPFIVGYQFRALEDMLVPECGTTDNFKNDPMNYNPDMLNNKKDVKAGDLFNMTPFEMALLACDPRVNKRFAGGDRAAYCSYAKKTYKAAKSGNSAVVAREIPRAVLRLEGEGSIKDYHIINVIEKTMVMGEDGVERKVGKVVPGYEKWEPLCKTTKKVSGARGTSTKTSEPMYDPNAASFLALLRSKGYQG